MTTYRTNNPIGSIDPRDLFDNAENLDNATNTQDSDEWVDRLGVTRKTFKGMENDFQSFLLSSGYEDLGAYQTGIQITARNQIVLSAGEYWRVAASTVLPYTTTGAGMPEGGAFVSVGDAALRQELAAPGGAGLVGNGGIVFDSVADMQAATWLQVGQKVRTLGYYTPGDGGGNDYEIVGAATGTDDGGSFIDLSGSGLQAKATFPNGANVLQFGAYDDPNAFISPGSATDQWEFFNAASLVGFQQVDVPLGRYRVAQATEGDVLWRMHPGSTVSGNGRARIGSYDNLANLSGAVMQWPNQPIGGDGSPYEGRGGFRFGDPNPYESDFLGHSATAAISGIGRNGGVGLLSATQASTSTTATNVDVLQVGAAFYAVNDRTDNPNHIITAAYTESTRMPGSATTFAQETTIKNFGEEVSVTALAPPAKSAGAAVGIQLLPLTGPISGSGSVDLTDFPTAAPANATYAIGVIGQADEGGVGFDKGLLFFKGSISGSTGTAVEMFLDYGIGWRSNAGSIDSRLYRDEHRMSFNGSTAQGDSAKQVFWRHRGTTTNRAQTLDGDVVGRTTYHGHQDSTFGFTGATNRLAETYVTQTSAVNGANAEGDYSIRAYNSTGGSGGVDIRHFALRPTGDATYDLGTSSNRFRDAYIANGVTTTSDEREKQQIRDFSDSEQAVAKQLKGMVKAFKWNRDVDAHGEKAQWQFGVIAQQVRDVFIENGLDPLEYGVLVKNDTYGVKYDQLMAFIISAM